MKNTSNMPGKYEKKIRQIMKKCNINLLKKHKENTRKTSKIHQKNI